MSSKPCLETLPWHAFSLGTADLQSFEMFGPFSCSLCYEDLTEGNIQSILGGRGRGPEFGSECYCHRFHYQRHFQAQFLTTNKEQWGKKNGPVFRNVCAFDVSRAVGIARFESVSESQPHRAIQCH